MLGVALPPPGARFHGALPEWGHPIHTAIYADGPVVCAYLVKADATIGSDEHRHYLTWVWDAATGRYIQASLPDHPRPLYLPHNFDAHPTWTVFVFDREDMVDAFHKASGDAEVIATTTPGGPSKFDMGSWGALYERTVVLWPSNHADSVQAHHTLGRELRDGGAKVSLIQLPQDKPANWSFLHIVEAGWTWEQIEAFVRENRRDIAAQVVPIRPARGKSGSAAAVAQPPVQPPTQAQPTPQILSFRAAWQRIPNLTYAPNGTPYSNLYNIQKTIEAWKGDHGKVWYDAFHDKVMTMEGASSDVGREWRDLDSSKLCSLLQGSLGFSSVRSATVYEAVQVAASSDTRHEVRDWLNTLEWDGTPRLVVMLHRGWGTEASPYTSAVGRCFLVAAVARVMDPGCQVDYVPVFEGVGRSGKTSALRELFGLHWFDNPSAMFGEKDFLQNMRGKWCLELGEMANIKGRAIEIVKSIVTRREDLYRASYERSAASHKRQCVFAGTIDRPRWNTDDAGGTRWWPIVCGKIDLQWIRENRAQLFAEALHRYRAREEWWNVPMDEARARQSQSQDHDVYEDLISSYLIRTAAKEVTMKELLRDGVQLEDTRAWDRHTQERIHNSMRKLGWLYDIRSKGWRNPNKTE